MCVLLCLEGIFVEAAVCLVDLLLVGVGVVAWDKRTSIPSATSAVCECSHLPSTQNNLERGGAYIFLKLL